MIEKKAESHTLCRVNFRAIKLIAKNEKRESPVGKDSIKSLYHFPLLDPRCLPAKRNLQNLGAHLTATFYGMEMKCCFTLLRLHGVA